MHLGYREATLLADCPLGPAGAAVRGHEFHYASVSDPGGDAPLAELRDAAGAPLAGSVAVGLALAAAFLNAAFGFCLGCELYLLGRRVTPSRAH